MARITVEDCLANVPNRFSLVLLAAERTKQILKGEPVLIEDYRENKEVVTALREIAAGKVLPDLTDFNENANVVTVAGPAPVAEPMGDDEELPPEADVEG
jgi:DNA-directed RNA polymerase subunit omega